MTVLASAIISRIRRQLVDEKVTQHWSDAELMTWISDAQRAIVVASPSNNEHTEVFSLAAGTKQTLPVDAHILIDIKRNMGTDGTTPGRATRVVAREVLDTTNPDWHSTTKTVVVENFVYDPQQQNVFYVYPPNTGTGRIELSYAKVPVDITATSQAIEVPDIFQTAIFDYVMCRCHQKDTDYSAGDGKAQMYLQLFGAFIGQLDATQASENPNQKLGPANTASKGGAP